MSRIFLLLLIPFFSLAACLPVKKRISVPPPVVAEPEREVIQHEPVAPAPDHLQVKEPEELAVPEKTESELVELPDHGLVEEPLDLAESSADLQDTGLGSSLPEPHFVDNRLQFYRKKLFDWNRLAGRLVSLDAGASWPEGWHQCVQHLEYMLSGYGRLQESLEGNGSAAVSRTPVNPWGVVARDMEYLEGRCDQIFLSSGSRLDAMLDDFSVINRERLEFLIRRSMDQGNYQEAVAAYENLDMMAGFQIIPFSFKRLYAQALIRLERYEEAHAYLERLLAGEAGGGSLGGAGFQELWQVRVLYGDLLMILGRYQEAKAVYQYLDDQYAMMENEYDWVAGQLHFLADYSGSPQVLTDYNRLLRLFLKSGESGVSQELADSFGRFEKRYDDIGIVSSARRIMRKAEGEARRWARGELLAADDLIQVKDFQGARKRLTGLLAAVPATLKEEVELKLSQVEEAEEEDRQARRLLEEQSLAGRWQEGGELLDAKKYDQAIAVLTSLLDTDYHEEARQKLAKAVNKSAALQRRQAATLFVEAQRSGDDREKAALLLQSRRLLRQIVEKYPGSDILGKVVNNLQVLEEHIRRLDASLLDEDGGL